MKTSKLLIGCAIAAFAAVVIIPLAGYYALRQIAPVLLGRSPALAKPGIRFGSGFLSKSRFLADQTLGAVTDIVPGKGDPAPGVEIGIAGTEGADFVDGSGIVKSRVHFDGGPHSRISIVDVNHDGVCEFMNRGSWSSKAALLDHKGKMLWEYGGSPGVDDMAAGDINGDGLLEFAVGFNGGGGVDLVDSKGRKQWNQPDGNVWHVEMVDTNGDGRLEIVHTNAGGEITVRDASGSVISRSSAAAYCDDFDLCKWPTGGSRPYLLEPSDGSIWLFDYNGSTVARLDAPGCVSPNRVKVTPARLRQGRPEYLAVLVEYARENQSILYVYDSAKKLVYEESLPEAYGSIAAARLGKSGDESILIGGPGHILRYSLPSAVGHS